MRKIKNGDMVKIDFIGSIEGKEFPGGSASNYYLEIGSNSFIGNFENQLIGHEVGDIIDINVTFPKNYGVKELNGKMALFRTTVKYILDTDY